MYRFKLSRNSLTVEVNLYDGIDFVCPYYDNSTDIVANSSADLQYYVIYMVTACVRRPILCYVYSLTAFTFQFIVVQLLGVKKPPHRPTLCPCTQLKDHYQDHGQD